MSHQHERQHTVRQRWGGPDYTVNSSLSLGWDEINSPVAAAHKFSPRRSFFSCERIANCRATDGRADGTLHHRMRDEEEGVEAEQVFLGLNGPL